MQPYILEEVFLIDVTRKSDDIPGGQPSQQ